MSLIRDRAPSSSSRRAAIGTSSHAAMPKFVVIVCEDSRVWDGFYEEVYPRLWGGGDDSWEFSYVSGWPGFRALPASL